jgi:peptidoglycan/LPS O-acetylase OafA/YrhL
MNATKPKAGAERLQDAEPTKWKARKMLFGWLPGLCFAPLGLLILWATNDWDTTILLWAGLTFLPVGLITFGACLWSARPRDGRAVVWLGTVLAVIVSACLFFIGFLTIVSLPVGIVGLICCFGVGHALDKEKHIRKSTHAV